MSDNTPGPRFVMPDGHEIAIGSSFTIGRSVTNNIKLEGEAVSRRHAAVEEIRGKVLLSDLGSSNGTYINEKRITAPTELHDRDKVRIGGNVLLYRSGAPPASATVAWQTSEPLTLVRGDGAEFGLSRTLRLGRSDDNDLPLVNDTSASNHHAKIDLVAGQAFVTDLSSRNGTWVNGKRIPGPTRLNHGDKILLGDTVFRLRVGSQPLAATDEAKPKANPALGVGLFVGGGLLTIVIVGVVGVIGLALAGGWYFFLRATPAPTAIVALPTENSPALSATQQALGEQAALRALVFVVAPLGNPNTTRDASTGSGSLVSEQGYVLTNFHVIGDPDTGQFYNNEEWALVGLNWSDPAAAPDTYYQAEVVDHNRRLDLALLHIVALESGSPLPENLAFPFLPIGDSDSLKIGDPIAVIGYPGLGGDTPTLTRGSVSGFLVDERNNLDQGWIKTDAEINPGNSGGMAINVQGELIGVPTQAFTGEDVTGKISEIRPINIALPMLEQLP